MSKEKKRKEIEEEEDTPWYELEECEDTAIQMAMAHAKKEFHKFLEEEFQWEDCHPPIRIVVRELRSGDGTLGKGYVIDEIQEYEELIVDEEYACGDCNPPKHAKEPTEGRKEIQ